MADVQDAIQTAVGGNALTQVLQGEARYDLVMRYLPQYRDTKEAIENIRLLSPTGERVSLAQLCNIEGSDGASEIYREGNQRYIAIKYSVRGRDLGGAVEEAIEKVNEQVQAAARLPHRLGGRVRERRSAPQARLVIIVPLTVLLIFMISVHHVPVLQVGDADSGQRDDGAGRRLAGAAGDGHQLQRLLGRGIPGAVRRLGADRRDHAGVHQPAARARASRSRTRRSKARCCGCGPS